MKPRVRKGELGEGGGRGSEVMDGSRPHTLGTRRGLTRVSVPAAAPMCPRRALLRTGLLIGLLRLCACSEEDCVLGIVGQPVLLPCLHPELLRFGNLSVEWRKDDEVTLRSVWEGDQHEEMWGFMLATLPDDAATTGNFSLMLPLADPQEDNATFRLFLTSEDNHSAPLCTRCLRIAASFSFPQLQRKEAAEGDDGTTFLCRSSGGFPQPEVRWLINGADEPPEGSVTTLKAPLADSLLYNVTSVLTVNISKDASVSCSVQNAPLNETLTSTSYGVNGGPVVSRASEGMWMFSTGLCVVVGAMVIAGVAYQIHLDRISKRKKKEFQAAQRGYKRRRPPDMEETETVKLASKETDV